MLSLKDLNFDLNFVKLVKRRKVIHGLCFPVFPTLHSMKLNKIGISFKQAFLTQLP